MNEIMGVYRDHSKGVSKTHGGYNKILGSIEMRLLMKQYSGKIKQDWLLSSIEYEVNKQLFDPFKDKLIYMKYKEMIKTIKTKQIFFELFIRLKIKLFNYKRSN